MDNVFIFHTKLVRGSERNAVTSQILKASKIHIKFPLVAPHQSKGERSGELATPIIGKSRVHFNKIVLKLSNKSLPTNCSKIFNLSS